jgi:tRNA(Arg) A34 adenosine deaminase TadA
VLTEREATLLRRTFELAQQGRRAGDHPFGALLANPAGDVVLEAVNTVVTGSDVTAHAERNLVSLACRRSSGLDLRSHTLYSSTEPCPMCAGAIHWAGIGRVVYGLSQQALYEIAAADREARLPLPCRQVLAASGRQIEVVGPCLEAEALRPHQGFWADV